MTFSYLIDHTFKGITLEFYLRHLRNMCFLPIMFFVLPALWLLYKHGADIRLEDLPEPFIGNAVFLLGSWLLYPYSRCAYFLIFESILPLKFLEAIFTILILGILALVSALFCFALAFVGASLGLILFFNTTN